MVTALRHLPSIRRAGRVGLLLGALLATACHKAAPPQPPGDTLWVKVVEPKQLPAGGGEAHILVRIQKPGGKAFPGVQVRLQTSEGTLFSAGRVLVTDGRGMTRDRLTTAKTATITLNAGGTRYRFPVPVEKRRR